MTRLILLSCLLVSSCASGPVDEKATNHLEDLGSALSLEDGLVLEFVVETQGRPHQSHEGSLVWGEAGVRLESRNSATGQRQSTEYPTASGPALLKRIVRGGVAQVLDYPGEPTDPEHTVEILNQRLLPSTDYCQVATEVAFDVLVGGRHHSLSEVALWPEAGGLVPMTRNTVLAPSFRGAPSVKIHERYVWSATGATASSPR